MRLKSEQAVSIRAAVKKHDPAARIFLFGSRVDDNQRGGDIDLLVLSQKLTPDDRRAIKLDLYQRIGRQKIDLLLARDANKPFVRLALETGTPL
jgi:uncharacterized protein